MKQQLSELFPEQAKKHTSTRKRQRDEDASEDNYGRDEVTVEDVFSLESGWSVEALGEDDDIMQIGDEAGSCPMQLMPAGFFSFMADPACKCSCLGRHPFSSNQHLCLSLVPNVW